MPGGLAVPIVRCRLDGRQGTAAALRYVPLVEFELWRIFMQSRHRRRVTVEAVTLWVPEQALLWEAGFSPEDLEPVLRLHLELPGPYGVTVPVDRYLPAETYPKAREALLAHYEARGLRRAPTATPGYVIPAQATNDLGNNYKVDHRLPIPNGLDRETEYGNVHHHQGLFSHIKYVTKLYM